jgi:N-sulfoglucosamine sulfohydrolase
MLSSSDPGQFCAPVFGNGRVLNPNNWIQISLSIIACLGIGPLLVAEDPPNVLIIIADDCTYNDLPTYGGGNAKTPRIDQLCSEGLVFDHAYLSEAMCQPCRSELYSGQHPVRNGAAWNHSGSRPDIKSLPHYLGVLNYRVGLAGKVHVTPRSAYPFESVEGFDANAVRSPTRDHDLRGIKAFMDRSDEQPFCLVVALVEPHVPWVMGDRSQYPDDEIELPPYLVDTAVTRDAFARYLAEITYMDNQVGEILDTLDVLGKADDTLVLFTSEQGSQFPGCKWTNWDNGLHTALVARWPGKTPVGKRTNAIVQYADITPTLIEIGGGEPTDFEFDGSSFLHALTNENAVHRTYAYGVHNNIPEGPAYPIRTVTNGEFRYIRNLRPDDIYIEKHLMGIRGDGALNNPYWSTWVFESGQTAEAEWLVKRYMKRPAEHLYHTAKDPHELVNLAGEPKYFKIKDELSRELDLWMREQKDPGVPLDTREAHSAAKRGEHMF